MEKIDFLLMGAEGVVESGGIINKVYLLYYINVYIKIDISV